MLRIVTLLAILFSTSLAAQTATYSYVSQKAPYSNPSPPLLTALNTPRIGSIFQLQVPYSWIQRNRSGANYLLATGLTNPNVPIAALGGYLFSSAEILIPTPMSPLGAPGKTTVGLPVPNASALIGFRFHQQLVETFTTSPAIRLSRGGLGVIGK